MYDIYLFLNIKLFTSCYFNLLLVIHMTNQKLVEKYLLKSLWKTAMEYNIGEDFFETMGDLIELILLSRSIDTHEEKQNRFNLLPLMNDEQIEKLRAILVKEKRKLKEIEEKYSKKKTEIKKKKLTKEQELQYMKKVSNIRKKEKEIDKQEDKEADALLDSL